MSRFFSVSGSTPSLSVLAPAPCDCQRPRKSRGRPWDSEFKSRGQPRDAEFESRGQPRDTKVVSQGRTRDEESQIKWTRF